MDIITDLKIQKRNKNRVNVSLDNKFFCVMNLETVVKNNLKKGTIISEQKLKTLQDENEQAEAFNTALKLVSKRFKTNHELRTYLKNKGYLDVVINNVIGRLKEYNYIDDGRYCESYITHHQNKGKNLLKQELWNKGISEQTIDDMLKNISDQTEQIKALMDKWLKNKESTKENYQKLTRYLINKGFSYEEILKVLKKEVE
jgi:regulatory protein